MGVGKVILVVASVLMVAGLYLFGSVGPNTSIADAEESTSAAEVTTFSFDEAKQKTIAQLKEEVTQQINTAETAVTNAVTNEEKATTLSELIESLKGKAPVFLVAHYQFELATIQNDEDNWMLAGIYANTASGSEQRDPAMKLYMANRATEAYENVIELNPENTDAKIQLAATYMEGSNRVMDGVQMLLAIVADEPNNIEANLILGRYGIISGQYEKAIQRLETVIHQDPSNAEAYYYLAEAYNGIGETEKAIELFEKCKTLVDDPEFSSEIDGYIQRLKNS